MVSTAGGIVIAVVVLLIAAAVGWVVFTQLRARRLGVRALSHLPSIMSAATARELYSYLRMSRVACRQSMNARPGKPSSVYPFIANY